MPPAKGGRMEININKVDIEKVEVDGSNRKRKNINVLSFF